MQAVVNLYSARCNKKLPLFHLSRNKWERPKTKTGDRGMMQINVSLAAVVTMSPSAAVTSLLNLQLFSIRSPTRPRGLGSSVYNPPTGLVAPSRG
jgi:hypothetical protein